MNCELFSLSMCSVVGGLGYLVTNVHLKEAEVLRIHGGLRKYLEDAQYATPEILRKEIHPHTLPVSATKMTLRSTFALVRFTITMVIIAA
jgi:hypothetical protein